MKADVSNVSFPKLRNMASPIKSIRIVVPIGDAIFDHPNLLLFQHC